MLTYLWWGLLGTWILFLLSYLLYLAFSPQHRKLRRRWKERELRMDQLSAELDRLLAEKERRRREWEAEGGGRRPQEQETQDA